MKNSERFKTANERAEAFRAWFNGRCDGEKCHDCPMNPCGDVIEKCFVWLDLPAPEEKPMPCPFCGGDTRLLITGEGNETRYKIVCGCGYHSRAEIYTADYTIKEHNRICRAVAAAKEVAHEAT